jgi:hypothetical protein
VLLERDRELRDRLAAVGHRDRVLGLGGRRRLGRRGRCERGRQQRRRDEVPEHRASNQRRHDKVLLEQRWKY